MVLRMACNPSLHSRALALILAIAVLVGLIGYFVVRKGLSNLTVQHLTPERTLHSLNRDAAVAKEQVQ